MMARRVQWSGGVRIVACCLLLLALAVPLLIVAATPDPASIPSSSSSPLPPCALSVYFPASGSGPPHSASPPVSSSAGVYVRVDAWGVDSARVRVSPSPIIVTPSPSGLTPLPPPSPSCVTTSASSSPSAHSPSSSSLLRADVGNLRVDVSPADGFVSVSRLSPPTVLLTTTNLSFTPYPWTSTYYQPTYPSYYSVQWTYTQPAGLTYGLGEHHHGREELPYTEFDVDFTFPETAPLKGDISIPWAVHSVGMATLWNQPGFGSVHVHNNGTQVTWAATQTPQFDAFFATSPVPDNRTDAEPPYERLIQRLLTATNSYPPPLPHYASGFWQCKLRYRSRDEVMAAAYGYVNRSLPLSVIVVDAINWAALGDFAMDPKCFPDPAGMVRELRAIGVELMVSLWPHAGALSSNFPTMKSHGYLTHNSTGQFLNESIPWMPWPPGPQPEASAVDFVSPAASDYMSDLFLENYVRKGIRMFWLDADEPDCAVPGQQWWAGRPDVEIVSAYPLGVIKTVKAALDKGGVSDGMMLTRGSWIGGQAMGAAVWSGDIVSTFAELRRQVLVSQNVALSGIYHWTTDVGGFIGGVLGNATFEELAVRWFQFGAPGLPDSACGSSGGVTEVWYFKHADIIGDLLRLRSVLRPYVERHLILASREGRPLLQPMFYTFPDPDCYSAAAQEQFMFGPEYLVAPILQEQATSRTVFLPRITRTAALRLRESREAVGTVRWKEEETERRGQYVRWSEEDEEGSAASLSGQGDRDSYDPQALVWRHFYSQKEYEGGQWITVPTAINDFPLFQLTQSINHTRARPSATSQ